jgi:acetate kinase
VFTGGIGENSVQVRTAVCAGLSGLGIELDPNRNANAQGEMKISIEQGPVQIWIVPTNEELIVARQSKQVLEES